MLEANAREQAVYQTCVAELGYDVAEARIPRGHCGGLAIGPEAVDHWRRSRQKGFGRGETRPVSSGLVAVTFVRDYKQYGTGETAGFSPKEALALVDRGVAEATPDAIARIVALPPDPRQAVAPAPGPEGRVSVLVVRSFSEDAIGLDVVNGGFTPGDVAAFPLDQATRYVRQGFAEFVDTGSGGDPVSAEGNGSDDTPKSALEPMP